MQHHSTTQPARSVTQNSVVLQADPINTVCGLLVISFPFVVALSIALYKKRRKAILLQHIDRLERLLRLHPPERTS